MAVIALHSGYIGDVKDREDNFDGNRLLFVNWENHQMFCSPVCLPLPASMPFGVFISEVLPGIYGDHPDFSRIDWTGAAWTHGSTPFTPDPARTLDENGLRHKSFVRLTTPGLEGLQRSHC